VRLPEVIFLSGGVGSGKKTALQRIKEKYGFHTIDTSSLLKAAAETNSAVKEAMDNVRMVSSD
jgi:dephospho-CoA kinase